MEQEARETPSKIRSQLAENYDLVKDIGEKIRQFDPQFVVTVGRGTSDHAGVFAKYLIEIELGLSVASAAPSVSSVFHKKMRLDKALVLFISQSGRSPDILAQIKMAKEAGAFCVALVNDEEAPIGEFADAVIPLRAGEEKAVAATKSYLATLSALLQLVGFWAQDAEIIKALCTLPEKMEKMTTSPVQLQPSDFDDVKNCVVLGRGFGYAISLEIALKLKEVCSIHAEAFSSAEFFHGPVTLVENKLRVIDILIEDETKETHQTMVEDIERRGGIIAPMTASHFDEHPRLAPLLLLQRFYLDVEKIAQSLGLNPDAPSGLLKVTKTL
jgi:glucosamine--fructose-6-phosphate aminotransferase (isomerizing)